ncbi:hypothetical protein PG995_008325 [Apiospora arundinis]
MEYNLDELDANLSNNDPGSLPPRPSLDRRATTGGHSGGARSQQARTRRGSLMPVADAVDSTSTKSGPGGDGAASRRSGRRSRMSDLNLFNFELQDLAQKILLNDGETSASYHEYAVYTPPVKDRDGPFRSPSIMADSEEALRMFRGAIRDGHGLDDEGEFVEIPPGKPRLLGRVRQLIVDRRPLPVTSESNSHQDGLFLTQEDYNSLDLHAATLPTIGRVTSESSFWDARKETLYIVFSFSANPQPPYDFLSMAYKLKTRTTTALIRRSFDTRWHDDDALDEYEKRLEASRSLWAHPLVLPIVLLQVQFLRTEEEVVANNDEVLELEGRVDDLTGRAKARKRIPRPQSSWRRGSSSGGDSPVPFGPLRRFSTFVEEKVTRRSHDPGLGNGKSSYQATNPALFGNDYVPPQTIHLMKEAHDVLKGAIKLLDTLRWMERAVKLLVTVGDELDARIKVLGRRDSPGKAQGKEGADQGEEDELTLQWHEIRQYLESTWRLCTALETDRRMSELRCRAQIDIIYSKMAQEDNNLNARMAVASTRDSSSMKALAVITAIFLPGEYMGTLFGMSFFNWEYNTQNDQGLGDDAPPAELNLPHVVIMPLFWVYWSFTIPLTFFIVVLWRAWWVNQDRFFRRHLSVELSNERYWTSDGRPRDLETTFMQDFLSVFKRSGATTTNSSIVGENAGATASARKKWLKQQGLPSPGLQRRGLSMSTSASLKEGDGTDTDEVEGARRRPLRTKTISFAGPGAAEPPSAV